MTLSRDRLRHRPGYLVVTVLPVSAILAVAPNLPLLTAGWIVTIAAAAFLEWQRVGPERAVRQAAWQAMLIPLLPALAVVAGVDRSWFVTHPGEAVGLATAGLVVAAIASYLGRDAVIAAAAAVVAFRAALATDGSWTLQVAAAALTFGLLASGWRVAATLDVRRRRMRSRRRALTAFRAIDARGFDVVANAFGRLVDAWSALAGRAVPVSLAEEARLVVGGLVVVVAYLLWAY